MKNLFSRCWRIMLQSVSGASRSLDLFLLILASGFLSLTSIAQPTILNEDSQVITLPEGAKVLRWYARLGNTYFIQVADANDPLRKWKWSQIIEPGQNNYISHEVGGTAAKGFFRLVYTDQNAADLDNADFDGDGISNIDEIIADSITGTQTNPLDPDTDHDGLTDKFERDHDLDPNDDGSVDPNNGPTGDLDGDGVSNIQEQTDGTNPNNPDFDGDGLTDGEEKEIGSNPNSKHSDNDGVPDGEDADPTDPLVTWPRVPESSYLMIEIQVPADAGGAVDLNDKGEVLFGGGIWAGGNWTAKSHANITGVFPGTVNENFPNGIPYEVPVEGWGFFNNDRQLLQSALLHPTDGPGVDTAAPCPIFWPALQSAPSLIYETADLWDHPYEIAHPLGITASGEMLIRTLLMQRTATPNPTPRIERFDSTGAAVGSMDGTGGYHPNIQWDGGDVTPSGWVASNLSTSSTSQLVTNKLGLWDAANNLISLPDEANILGFPLNLSDLPNEKVVLVASSAAPETRVFLPDESGTYQYVSGLSTKKIQLFAGDGTAMTNDGKLWRNGKLIPLRDLSPKIKELEDAGYSLFPLKANKHGMYLIQAQKPTGETVTGLLAKVEFKLRNANDFDKGWDDTNKKVGPWTSCGVNRTKLNEQTPAPDDTIPYPNAIVGLVIPGCTAALGNLLELFPAPGSEQHVSLTNQTITGEVTPFDIQGTLATPAATGCQIIVREKANHANKSGPLNVHVFNPRVVEFQVYVASDSTIPQSVPGSTPAQAIIKQELNTTYREQSNITFHEVQPAAATMDHATGIFETTTGIIPEAKAELLAKKATGAHLKIFIVKGVVRTHGDDIAGLAAIPGDWAIVEATTTTDVYSHETGHALNLTIKPGSDKTRHENNGVQAPYGGRPLMLGGVLNTRWIRQQDWKAANIQAKDHMYGH